MKKFFTVLMLTAAATPASAGCSTSASRAWVKGLTIEVFAQGPTCAQAVATMVIRGKAGQPVYMQVYDTGFLMSFTQPPAANAKALAAYTKDWISGEGFMKTADKLVIDGEFPFTVNEAVDAAALKRYRKEKAPIFCYIQGMESGNCLVQDADGTIVDLGIQSFPG